MRNDTKTLLIVGGIAVGLILINNKIGKKVGENVGENVGGLVSGSVVGLGKGIILQPYETAQNYQHYIPIIDDVAFMFSKNYGRGGVFSAKEFLQKNYGWS